jgi:hypothetical protein
MTLSAANRRGLLGAGGLALRSLLSAALLVPLVFLAVLVWGHTAGEGESADLERQGTEYFRALVPLEIALLDAQAGAVAGKPVPRENLDRAVQAVAEVDARVGDDLRSRQRWGEVRAKIEALPNGRSTSVDAVFAAYTETTDVLLALFDKVRTSSKVILDPEIETYFLHDGVTQELPSAIAAAGELSDLTVVLAGKNAAQRAALMPDVLTRRVALEGGTGDLVDDIRFAVDSTQSPTLGGNLLGRLDRFRRVVDSMLPATAALSDPSSAVDAPLMTKNRTEAQAAAADLSQAMLRELDLLLADRQSTLRTEFLIGVGSVLAIAALAVGAIVVDVLSRRRAAPARPAAEGAGAHIRPGPFARPAPAAQPPPVPVPVPGPPPAGGSGDAEPDPWERYVATR